MKAPVTPIILPGDRQAGASPRTCAMVNTCRACLFRDGVREVLCSYMALVAPTPSGRYTLAAELRQLDYGLVITICNYPGPPRVQIRKHNS